MKRESFSIILRILGLGKGTSIISAIFADGPLDISTILSDINNASSILCVIKRAVTLFSVSYTHLTLPTIYSV